MEVTFIRVLVILSKNTKVQPKSYDFDSVVNSSGRYNWREMKGQSGNLEWDEDTKR